MALGLILLIALFIMGESDSGTRNSNQFMEDWVDPYEPGKKRRR